MEEDPIYKSKKLDETSDIKEYYQAFDSIRRNVVLPEELLLSWFVAGLRMDTRREVRAIRPQTVIHAYAYGRLYELAYPMKSPLLTVPIQKSSSSSIQESGQIQSHLGKTENSRNFQTKTSQANTEQRMPNEKIGANSILGTPLKVFNGESNGMKSSWRSDVKGVEQKTELENQITVGQQQLQLDTNERSSSWNSFTKTVKVSNIDREADFRHQIRRVLGVHPKESSREIKDQSYLIGYEFRGNTTSLNLEFPRFEECSWIGKCEKHFRNCEIGVAQQVFEEMPIRRFYGNNSSSQLNKAHLLLGNRIFVLGDFIDPRIDKRSDMEHQKNSVMEAAKVEQKCNFLGRIMDYQIFMPYDRGKNSKKALMYRCENVQIDSWIVDFGFGSIILVFDPGGVLGIGNFCAKSSSATVMIYCCWVICGLIFVFDPGGMDYLWLQLLCCHQWGVQVLIFFCKENGSSLTRTF